MWRAFCLCYSPWTTVFVETWWQCWHVCIADLVPDNSVKYFTLVTWPKFVANTSLCELFFTDNLLDLQIIFGCNIHKVPGIRRAGVHEILFAHLFWHLCSTCWSHKNCLHTVWEHFALHLDKWYDTNVVNEICLDANFSQVLMPLIASWSVVNSH